MKTQILISIFLLLLLVSCTDGGGGNVELSPTSGWYQELNQTEDDNLRLALYDKIIEIDPQDSYAYFGRADIYKNLGKYDEALQDFTRAIRVDDPGLPPTKQEIYCSRGDVYASLGKLYSAIEDYSEAIRIEPMYSQAYESRANIYQKLGKQDEASRDQQTAISLSLNASDTLNEDVSALPK